MTDRSRGAAAIDEEPALEVVGARTHNLKQVSCRIPHGRVTVVTGPSGAGKSSLAFDTVFAEGQRRFVESMSTYARQFLDQMERPPVDRIDGVLPCVALEAKNAVKNARSTVGTITEVHDVLRLLFTHLGEVQCPEGHGPVRRLTAASIVERLVAGSVGPRITLVMRVPRPKRGAREALAELIRQGYGRVLVEGGDGEEIERLEPGARWPKARDPLPVVLGRFGAESDSRARLLAAVERALEVGEGVVEARGDDGVERLRAGLSCPVCARSFVPPSPPLFSFNSPLGACETCQGFGRVIGIDRSRVVPDPGKTLRERPIAPWNTPAYEEHYDPLFAAAAERGVPLDVPWAELAAEDRDWVWRGKGFVNLERFFRWLERRSYRVHVRVLLARYRAYDECPDCGGSRLQPDALAVRVHGETLPALSRRAIAELRAWLAECRFDDVERRRAGPLLDQLAERLDVLDRVGLGYLTLDRQARTLSGGETQRIHLAAALGSGLTSTLYVLDEPTVGLHALDSEALLLLLRDLAERGNTVLVVEHDPALIRGADWLIDLGPAAGERGGRLMAEGPPEQVLRASDSPTARWLGPEAAQGKSEDASRPTSAELEAMPQVEIRGAREHNLRDLDVAFPRAAMVAVTGVSGSGKSSLIADVLHANYQRGKGVVDVDPGACDQLHGLEELDDVVLVDQRPLGRSTRSNPVTYTKAYDELRKLFAGTAEAKANGITAGHFSFNTDKGRCPDCQGTGTVEVDMHFMAPVEVTCDRCQGHRFRPEVLRVRLHGRDIAETLELTVEEAARVFRDEPRLVRRLAPLQDVGLGYLRLGQSTATLSGGEAQRLKLASFLTEGRRRRAPRLFLFDEPTTGLHLSDIDQLYRTLRRFVDAGDGVVVVEHNLELIARCDWVVDLGPGGGVDGGHLLFSGPLERFLAVADTPTATALRAYAEAQPGPQP